MDQKEMIFKRKSCRSYTDMPVSGSLLDQVKATVLQPLYPQIKTHWEIVPREQVRCLCPWTTPQVITIYSEKKPGYLENAGFLFQQLELQLQCLGLGVCWLGMGRLASQGARHIDGMEFIIMLAFGFPKASALRESPEAFKRKLPAQIADRPDPRLEPARLAPSSVNSQPWYFTHEDDTLHVFCAHKGVLKFALNDMNRIDIGIALAHLYLSYPESFRFFRTQSAAPVKGHSYIGSFVI